MLSSQPHSPPGAALLQTCLQRQYRLLSRHLQRSAVHSTVAGSSSRPAACKWTLQPAVKLPLAQPEFHTTLRRQQITRCHEPPTSAGGWGRCREGRCRGGGSSCGHGCRGRGLDPTPVAAYGHDWVLHGSTCARGRGIHVPPAPAGVVMRLAMQPWAGSAWAAVCLHARCMARDWGGVEGGVPGSCRGQQQRSMGRGHGQGAHKTQAAWACCTCQWSATTHRRSPIYACPACQCTPADLKPLQLPSLSIHPC